MGPLKSKKETSLRILPLPSAGSRRSHYPRLRGPPPTAMGGLDCGILCEILGPGGRTAHHPSARADPSVLLRPEQTTDLLEALPGVLHREDPLDA